MLQRRFPWPLSLALSTSKIILRKSFLAIPRIEHSVTPEQVTTSGFNLASVQWRAGPAGKVYGENSVAGLLVMIMSYVTKAAPSPSDTDMNLKTLVPLMPRRLQNHAEHRDRAHGGKLSNRVPP